MDEKSLNQVLPFHTGTNEIIYFEVERQEMNTKDMISL